MKRVNLWKITLVTLAAALALGAFLRDASLRPTYLSTERRSQVERCLAADPMQWDRKTGLDEVQAECVDLLATQNCRAAWRASNRKDPQAHNPQRACLASICDEWTSAPRFCRHPDYAGDSREVFYYTAQMASAVLGRGLSEAEDRLVIAALDRQYCDGPFVPRPAEIEWASPHLRRTLLLTTKLFRLTGNLDERVPPWRPPDCEPWRPKGLPKPRAAQD